MTRSSRSVISLVLFSLVVLSMAFLAVASSAQVIDPSRGADPKVDYASLKAYGPWDDRNYNLEKDDLALFASREAELAESEAIPAFYRLELRRKYDLPKSGEPMYPRSGLPGFWVDYQGYLIDGRFYMSARKTDDGWQVNLEADSWDDEGWAQKFLSGEARVTNPNGAAESAIAINPVNPNLVIAGSNGPGSGQRMHFSSDGGETWSTVASALPGSCCDPTVGWSSDGTIAYTSTLNLPELFFYRSTDNGQTWIDQVQVDDNSGFVDKQYLHVDTHPTSPHLDNIYHTWHEGNILKFSRSTDMGVTWGTELTLSGAGESGIGSDITSDSAGNVYHFWPATGGRDILVRKSTNGGVSFAPTVLVSETEGGFDFPIPVMESRRVFIYVSADADRTGGPFNGRIYAAWTDNIAPDSGTAANNHARIQVGHSTDGGATWNVTTPHETADELTVDRFHQWLAVAPDGSVHVIFYDTRRDLPGRNQVDIFRSKSTDGGVTWSVPERVTGEQSPNINDSFEWGDYNGLDAIGNDLIAIYTDNRDEAGGDPTSVDVYAAGFESGGAIFTDGFESGDTSAWSSTIN